MPIILRLSVEAVHVWLVALFSSSLTSSPADAPNNGAPLSDLRANGYETVINLLPHDSQYAIKNEEAIVIGQGIDYLSIPVDFAAPTEQDYSEFVQAITSCQERKVLIHCAANFRVSAFYAIYAYEYLGWSAAQAREHIESIWRPEENPPWDQFISLYLPSNG